MWPKYICELWFAECLFLPFPKVELISLVSIKVSYSTQITKVHDEVHQLLKNVFAASYNM